MSTMKESGERLLISTSEAARMLSIGKTSLFRIIASGELKVVRLGGGIVRVSLGEIRRIAGASESDSGGGEAA